MNKENLNNMDKLIKKDYKNMTGIVINRDGNNIYENYFNGCTKESSLHIYSVTKSIVSLLLGIAIDRGLITDLNTKILDFFPEYKIKGKNRTIMDITLKHILTMTAPYKYKLFPPYIKYFTSLDWLEFSLDILGGKGKIGRFKYTPLIGPDILSGILQKVTGSTVLELANEHLFKPLDITPRENITFKNKEEQMAFNKGTNTNGWVSDSRGTNSAGWGLTLSPTEMSKIAQLVLNKGLYNSTEIVSKEWINQLITPHSRWNAHNLDFGLLWWIVDRDKEIYAAMGDGGNTIYINRSENLTVSITSLFTHRAKDRIKFIQEYIEKSI